MKASWEKTENNQGVLTVEVDGETVEKALNQAFRKVVKRVTVPGFRKGKVPRAIFERRFGVEVLYEDALDILLPDAYASAVKETGIRPSIGRRSKLNRWRRENPSSSRRPSP